MSHYAFLNQDNKVVKVIPGRNENDLENLPEEFSSWEEFYADYKGMPCKRTSYNTYGNQHKLGGTPFRGNFAGKHFTYDEENDVFIAPKPWSSWVLNEETWLWEPPIAYPDDGEAYIWNENAHLEDNTTGWELLNAYGE